MYQGTAFSLLKELITFCGPNRTLAMPAFFFGGQDQDPIAYYRQTARLNIKSSPSQMGLLTELFSRHPGVKRSMHPTHSVCALGSLADELTGCHHQTSSFGEASPFGVMNRKKTLIVGIGVRYFRHLTHVHVAEEIMGEEYPLKRTGDFLMVEIVAGDGKRYSYPLRYWRENLPRKIEMLKSLMNPGELKEWKFRGVSFFCVEAKTVTDTLVRGARRGITIYKT